MDHGHLIPAELPPLRQHPEHKVLWHRHHIHCVIERPQHIAATDFILLAQSCWTSTRFGYQQSHFELPTTEQRELGWIDYCLKARTKTEYSSCIDWSNSTCFELR
jgi:hypothetical protein